MAFFDKNMFTKEDDPAPPYSELSSLTREVSNEPEAPPPYSQGNKLDFTPAYQKKILEEERKKAIDARRAKYKQNEMMRFRMRSSPGGSQFKQQQTFSSRLPPMREKRAFTSSLMPRTAGLGFSSFTMHDMHNKNSKNLHDCQTEEIVPPLKSPKNVSQTERTYQGIPLVFDPGCQKRKLEDGIDFTDMRSALTKPIPKNVTIQCRINRVKQGVQGRWSPHYELYHMDGKRFLLSAKKRDRMKNRSSNYIISMDKDNLEKKNDKYIGKLRANFLGTEFVIFDHGKNPKLLEDEKNAVTQQVRKELGCIFYESNILGSRGPRKMTAIIPVVDKNGNRAVWQPLKPDESIVNRYKARESEDRKDTDMFITLVNKTPKWNDHVGAYVLNFNGRVTMASVKNFQLINQEYPEQFNIQFGRIGKDTFTMDCRYPLSIYQSFAICLSSFDYKLACE